MNFAVLAAAAFALSAAGAHAQGSGFTLGAGYQHFDKSRANFDLLTLRAGFEWAFAGPNVLRVDYTRYDLSSIELDGGANGFGASYVRRF